MESGRSPARKASDLEGEMGPRGPSTAYFYLPLADALKMINVKVNLFAAVSEIREPKRSRGTDYVLTLKIRDQSYSAPGLSVNFFAESTTKLPHVRSTGDIISLHRVVMKIHNGEFYCVYNKRFSSFALFEGKTAESFRPYQASTEYKATDHDNEFLSQLRTWLLNYLHGAVLNEYSLQLNRIKIGHVFDLICKVLHLCETSDGEWVLFVWDGTDTPPVSFTMDLDNEGKTPSPLHVEEFSLSREVLHAFPRGGTVLRIFADKYFKEIPQLQGGGHWVKLCNIICELQSDMWKGVLQPSSKIHLLSDQDDTVLQRLKMYNDRITSNPKCQPFMSFPQPSDITDTDFRHAAFATLMDSLTYPEATHRCKCIVRVVAAYPWRAEDLRSPIDGHYRIRLTLEDPTTRIHAYVYREDGVGFRFAFPSQLNAKVTLHIFGHRKYVCSSIIFQSMLGNYTLIRSNACQEKFFGGYPTNNVLASKMNMLLGITDGAGQACATRDPPWVWCCLKSYYLDKSNPWGTRRYRIFGTKLTG